MSDEDRSVGKPLAIGASVLVALGVAGAFVHEERGVGGGEGGDQVDSAMVSTMESVPAVASESDSGGTLGAPVGAPSVVRDGGRPLPAARSRLLTRTSDCPAGQTFDKGACIGGPE